MRELAAVVSAESVADGRDPRPAGADDSRAHGRAATPWPWTACCLTASDAAESLLTFHAVPETLSRTTLGDLRPSDLVNVEPALRAGDPLGGHYVQGHVDAVGSVQSVEAEGEGLRVFVEAPSDVLRYCVEQGVVTVDGVSLTVAELAADAFAVALVPHTLEATTLVRASTRPGG